MTRGEFKARYEKIPVVEYQNCTTCQPKVSICVQTYQHANFINECLEGLLMQKTNFSYEILLGEDASSDGTRELCRQYAEKYQTIVRLFLHSRLNNIYINGNPSGRFNFLNNVYMARGEYIAICEGDDIWTDPYKLQKQVDFLDANLDFAGVGCYSDKLEYHKDKSVILKSKEPFRKLIYSFEDLYIRSIAGTKTCTMVYRRRGPLQEFPDWALGLLSGDRAIAVSMLKDIGKICILPFVGAVYRVHSGGVWSSLSKHQIRANLQINYETISRHIFDNLGEKFLFFWLHFRKTIRHDVANFNVKYIYRSFKVIFDRA